jgi:hypothetical protein
MSENVGASTSHDPEDLHGLYRDNFTLLYSTLPKIAQKKEDPNLTTNSKTQNKNHIVQHP